MYYLCIELLGTIIVLSECRCRAWVCCGGVCRLAGWVCLGETRVFVCLLSVLMSCVRSCSGWVRPAFSLWCSLVVLLRVSECAHGQWAKPIRYLACLL